MSIEPLGHYRNALVQRKYNAARDVACGPLPAPDLLGNVELDMWMGKTDIAWEMLCLKGRHGDFTTLNEDAQRCFLLLAAEVLYGPNLDPELLHDCIVEANETI